MNKDRIENLIEVLSEEYAKLENTFLIRNNQQLVKYMENPESWKEKQLQHRLSYKNQLVADAKRQLKVLNDKTAKVLLLSYAEVDKDIIEIKERELVVNKFSDEIKAKVNELKSFNAQQIAVLADTAYKTYTRTVQIIDATTSADKIYEGVKKQLPKGIANGLKVVYSNGREMNWRSYMEMNARTTVNQEITNKQIEIGAINNTVFYMCDSFGDCAKDHADYQGKVYYNADANITKEIQDYIDANNILSMQEVSQGEPYLTTRPNCRHNFHAIPTDKVLVGTSNAKLLDQYNLKEGNYQAKNYEDLVKQRYNERQIRKWKTELENQKQIAKTTGVPNNQAISKATHKVSEWQGKQRELIASNPKVLERDYDRESIKIITEDLGVKYRYKVVDGELVKKTK